MSKCTACGDKPENTAKDFTKAVIEINNPETLVLLRKVVIPASMGDDTDVVPAIGKYRNIILQYEANGHIYLYSSDGIPTAIEANIPQEVLDQIAELENDVDSLERADEELQREIDELKNSPDVVDIVATYADLMAYDTQHLGNNDVIRVLRDETHEGQSSYYRWDKPHSTWTFIGTVGDYYTKQQVDTLLDGKQDELTPGENVSIVDESGELVISTQDTTYTAGYGLELNGTEFSVDSSVVQDTLAAGDNITIEDESGSLVISATDTTYSAGSGLDLTGATFSVDTSIIQPKLTAGSNITISGDTISATDTTYTAGNGLSLNGTQFSVDTTTIATQQDLSAEALARSDADAALSNRVTTIEGDIPAAASSSNQLADKNFVNSSVATNTANYISNNGEPFTSVAQLEAYSGTVTNNDYAFVTGTDGAGNTYYDRYKATVTGTPATVVWAKEYRLNNSSFTSDQWAAINSTVTSGDMTKLRALASIKSVGANLSLDANGELSATDTTYSAGYGLELNATEFSVDTSVIQDTLTAGDNITIEDESGALVISAADTKYTAGSNVQISPQNVISATDTTYTHFTGATASTDGVQGLVPGPLAGDEDKYLKGDGTWGTVQAGPTVVQNTGTSTTDVMSQNAVTSMVYADPSTKEKIKIGAGTSSSEGADGVEIGHYAAAIGVNSVSVGTLSVSSDTSSVAIGSGATASGVASISIGEKNGVNTATASGYGSVMIGRSGKSTATGSVAIGAYSNATAQGQMDIGTTDTYYGYNSSNYRLLTGLYDGQNDHDAVNLGQLNGRVKQNAGAPTTATVGTVGQLLEDTTNGDLYICTDATNPYVWEEVGAGGGPTVVQTTGTSTTSVMSQKAVTDTLFNNNDKYKIQIGPNASASGTNASAIGAGAVAGGGQSIAFVGGSTSTAGVMQIGTNRSGWEGTGYASSNYRLLTGLYDGQSAHDAVTKGQLDSAVSTLGTELDAKQDVLTAGQNITIAEESGALVISATGGSGADVFTTNEWNALWA